MKVFATGKWSKEQKRWSMVVAIRRPGKETATVRHKKEESPDARPRRTR